MKRLQSQLHIYALYILTLTIFVGCGSRYDDNNTITVKGTITTMTDSQPVVGANVAITSPDQFATSTTTDSVGAYQFAIDSEEAVDLTIVAIKDSFKDTLRTVTQAEPGEDYGNINLALSEAGNSEDGNGEDGDGEEDAVRVDGEGAAAIVLESEPPQFINIAATGNNVNTPITFQVIDSAGLSLAKNEAVEVEFKLVNSPSGEERLVPQKATTNEEGQVTTTLYSGNKAGEVKLQATVKASEMGFIMKSSPIQIAIHGGFPHSEHFSIARTKRNIEGYTINNARSVVSVILNDNYSNPVAPGTIVSFTTENGMASVQGSAQTDADGIAEVDLISADPRPDNGIVTVIASTVDGNDQRIQKSTQIVLSTSNAKVNSETTSLDLQPGEKKKVNFSVTDLNNNPMAEGTTINVSASDSIGLSGDTDITLGDNFDTGEEVSSFSIEAENLLRGTKALSEDISIEVTSPSGRKTTYNGIATALEGNPEPLPPPSIEFVGLEASTQNVDINSDSRPTVTATIGDENTNSVGAGTEVTFETTGGIIQGSATTDEDGKASVNFTSLKPRPAGGKVTVTATANNGNAESVEESFDLIFSTSDAIIESPTTYFELKQGASRSFSYSVTDENDNPMAAGTQIKVDVEAEGLEVSGDTELTVDDHLQSGTDKTDFQFNLRDTGESEKEDISVTITATSPSGKVTEYNAISGKRVIEGNDRVGAAAIVLTEEPKDFININETGDEVSAPLTFQVRDSLGRPLNPNEAVEVEFSLVSSPGGDEDLVPKTATSNGSGEVTTTLFSGNRAGEVKVQAIVRRPEIGLTVRSSPVLIAIHGGFPHRDHFSVAPEKDNFEGFNKNNNRNKIITVLGDEFSNPVKPGTIVYFETTGGIIVGSGKTDEEGIIEVDLISGDPRPTNGIARVTASTVNKNDIRIQKSFDVVLSTTAANISSNETTFDLQPGGGAEFNYTVQDTSGNAMAAGTQINVEAGEGIEVSGDANFILGDHLGTGPGKTDFRFSIRDTDDESNSEASLTIKISATPPSGFTSTYTITGTRR